jgi:protein-tyrosine phosphatase
MTTPRRSVLLVCHANTARSVMAHILLERMLAARDAGDRIRVRSGGIAKYARDGMIPSLDARLVLREVGILLAEDAFSSTDLNRHRHVITEADLILTMTMEQKQAIAALAETDGTLLFTLREFAGDDGDIVDPAMRGEEAFRHSRDEITRCLERSIDRLVATLTA